VALQAGPVLVVLKEEEGSKLGLLQLSNMSGMEDRAKPREHLIPGVHYFSIPTVLGSHGHELLQPAQRFEV